MSKQIIEILPGIRIEVTRRLRRIGGMRDSSLKNAATNPPEKCLRELCRSKRRGNLYSSLIIDEALKLTKEKGITYAEKATGVNRWSINKRIREIRAMDGLAVRQQKGTRYTMEQKRACVALAMKIMASGDTVTHTIIRDGKAIQNVRAKWPRRKAFIEAGRRMGINGRSVEWMWSQKML